MTKHIVVPWAAPNKAQIKHVKHLIKWSLIHAALVLFFADLLALIWPAFSIVWAGPVQKVGVALAALFACIAEYLYDDEELKHHIGGDDEG